MISQELVTVHSLSFLVGGLPLSGPRVRDGSLRLARRCDNAGRLLGSLTEDYARRGTNQDGRHYLTWLTGPARAVLGYLIERSGTADVLD